MQCLVTRCVLQLKFEKGQVKSECLVTRCVLQLEFEKGQVKSECLVTRCVLQLEFEKGQVKCECLVTWCVLQLEFEKGQVKSECLVTRCVLQLEFEKGQVKSECLVTWCVLQLEFEKGQVKCECLVTLCVLPLEFEKGQVKCECLVKRCVLQLEFEKGQVKSECLVTWCVLQLEFEKGQVKRAERECRRLTASVVCEQTMSARHKAVAIALIRERRRLFEGLAEVREQGAEVERGEAAQRQRAEGLATALAEEGQRVASAQGDSDALRQRLGEEETRRLALSDEVGRLTKVVELMEKQIAHSQQRWAGVTGELGEGAGSPHAKRTATRLVAAPVAAAHRLASAAQLQQAAERDWAAQRADTLHRTDAVAQRVDSPRRSGGRMLPERPSIGQKPELTVVPAATPAVFTTPSGTRISLNVTSGTVARRPTPGASRATPPPIPPNKPQMRLGSAPGGGRKEIPVKHQTTVGSAGVGSKVGITILKEGGVGENLRVMNATAAAAARPVDHGPLADGTTDGGATTRKPSQVCANPK